MSDALSSAEIDDQHVELLPDRTVMSIFSTANPTGGTGPDAGQGGYYGHRDGGELLGIRVGIGGGRY